MRGLESVSAVVVQASCLLKMGRTLAEAHAMMGAPGALFETEHQVVNGQVYRVYKQIPLNLREHWLKSKMHGDKTYLMYGDEVITYRQAHQDAELFARKLYHEHGVRKGDRIGIAARNLPEWVTFWWASQMLGAILCAVNAWLPSEPLVYCLTNTSCKVIFVDEDRLSRLDSHYKTLADKGMQLLLVARPTKKHSGAISFEEWRKGSAPPLPQFDIAPDDVCAIYFTSGTTGLPKGVIQTNRQMLTNFINTQVGPTRAALRRGDPLPPMDIDPAAPQKGLLLSTPLFHVTANHSLLIQITAFGGKICLMYKWDVKEAVRLIRKEKLTLAGGVPSMVAQLVESDLSKGENTLAAFLFGGAPSSKHLIGSASKAFPNCFLSQAYGLTETNSVAVSLAGEDYVNKPASCGLPTPVNDIMIMDPNDVECPVGTPGEIWLRGPNVANGYWNDAAATAKSFTSDWWFKSGDVGFKDSDGFLYISDRIKDIIIRGGENIPSTVVENAIYNDSRIMDAAALGVPDEKLGELVAAIVSPKPSFRGQLKEEEILAVARKALPYYAVPVLIHILDDPIPRNANGKVVKRDLKDMLTKAWEAKKAKSGKDVASKL